MSLGNNPFSSATPTPVRPQAFHSNPIKTLNQRLSFESIYVGLYTRIGSCLGLNQESREGPGWVFAFIFSALITIVLSLLLLPIRLILLGLSCCPCASRPTDLQETLIPHMSPPHSPSPMPRLLPQPGFGPTIQERFPDFHAHLPVPPQAEQEEQPDNQDQIGDIADIALQPGAVQAPEAAGTGALIIPEGQTLGDFLGEQLPDVPLESIDLAAFVSTVVPLADIPPNTNLANLPANLFFPGGVFNPLSIPLIPQDLGAAAVAAGGVDADEDLLDDTADTIPDQAEEAQALQPGAVQAPEAAGTGALIIPEGQTLGDFLREQLPNTPLESIDLAAFVSRVIPLTDIPPNTSLADLSANLFFPGGLFDPLSIPLVPQEFQDLGAVAAPGGVDEDQDQEDALGDAIFQPQPLATHDEVAPFPQEQTLGDYLRALLPGTPVETINVSEIVSRVVSLNEIPDGMDLLTLPANLFFSEDAPLDPQSISYGAEGTQGAEVPIPANVTAGEFVRQFPEHIREDLMEMAIDNAGILRIIDRRVITWRSIRDFPARLIFGGPTIPTPVGRELPAPIEQTQDDLAPEEEGAVGGVEEGAVGGAVAQEPLFPEASPQEKRQAYIRVQDEFTQELLRKSPKTWGFLDGLNSAIGSLSTQAELRNNMANIIQTFANPTREDDINDEMRDLAQACLFELFNVLNNAALLEGDKIQILEQIPQHQRSINPTLILEILLQELLAVRFLETSGGIVIRTEEERRAAEIELVRRFIPPLNANATPAEATTYTQQLRDHLSRPMCLQMNALHLAPQTSPFLDAVTAGSPEWPTFQTELLDTMETLLTGQRDATQDLRAERRDANNLRSLRYMVSGLSSPTTSITAGSVVNAVQTRTTMYLFYRFLINPQIDNDRKLSALRHLASYSGRCPPTWVHVASEELQAVMNQTGETSNIILTWVQAFKNGLVESIFVNEHQWHIKTAFKRVRGAEFGLNTGMIDNYGRELTGRNYDDQHATSSTNLTRLYGESTQELIGAVFDSACEGSSDQHTALRDTVLRDLELANIPEGNRADIMEDIFFDAENDYRPTRLCIIYLLLKEGILTLSTTVVTPTNENPTNPS
ncbi:DUF1539 domain-containing protein [Chlamydia vaughanii]|uniref:DUF1539 domain-containing protein n=1 Tax=Chlamydia vaughanii TaxID=3112552 RepID=UPI0032B1E73D